MQVKVEGGKEYAAERFEANLFPGGAGTAAIYFESDADPRELIDALAETGKVSAGGRSLEGYRLTQVSHTIGEFGENIVAHFEEGE